LTQCERFIRRRRTGTPRPPAHPGRHC
jgi:hypothetical protein